ncbi:hypothetical protein CONLIGDRAFT_627658 [Coniochaeta ligniaria NRRL 30616]|uniref:Anaphase-promoting complex subunit 2 n=1 Tax=Coniochaeta ligniaria NRRL 30616 TaxID=1408157 RepID=A0A1J7K5V4_9PEZI|nr:hypothetical protein CONLIGDRAFT_627658 [Coniochaeta ligniaria NRRL 30616]
MAAAVATSKWKTRRRRVYQSVFQTDITQPTPHSTPSSRFTEQGQPFGGHTPLSELKHRLHNANYALAASPDPAPGTLQPPSGHRNTTDDPDHRSVGTSSSYTPTVAASFASPTQPPPTRHFGLQDAAEDQMRYDRAWHVVTLRIALPASATAEDSFGTLASESQYQSQGQGTSSESEFYEALRLVVNAPTALPRAAHTEDLLFWHTQQVRRHFAQHVLPLLSACAEGLLGEEDLRDPTGRGSYEKHMIIVMSSVRTLEAAMRLYSYGMQLLVRGIQRVQAADKENAAADPELSAGRFRRDVHALVSNSASPQLMRSLRVVLVHLVGNTLGVPAQKQGRQDRDAETTRPAPPTENDLNSLASRKRLLELLDPLYSVGLAGERFQILFAEVMDGMMSEFVKGAYAGVWASPTEQHGLVRSTSITGLQATSPASSSPCISSLCNWVENHYARLAIEVLSRITDDPSQPPVTLSDVKTYQSLALGRLAALRISELFDIVLAWPSSRGALDDLRAAITTPARRLQLTDSFAEALRRRLLHPGRSTLEILQTYIAMIRTFHALDHSKVLLSRVSPNLQLYLCGREDAVRIVVTGLLASTEEIRAARMEKQMREEKEGMGRGRQARTPRSGAFMTPALPPRRGLRSRHGTPDVEEAGIRDVPPPSASTAGGTHSTKLVELALLMTDPVQSRRAGGADEDADLDWNDMSWVPDPIDAGANYKRPRSEDVIGTLISALGSQDTFIREFQVIVAERLLSDQARFDQEVRVLNLLKKRFGEAALQNCDVMIRDIQDSRRLDGAIRKVQGVQDGEQPRPPPAATPTNPKTRSRPAPPSASPSASSTEAPYHARILSRLFWPSLEREHFLLPAPISEQQKHYEQGYEHLKASRKLTWLNQLGQATVELELQDRTVAVDCKTYEATVIYAFQSSDTTPARMTVSDLEDQLQMDDDLITSALSFWASKGVLARRGDTYIVLETAPASDQALTSSAPGSPEAAAESEPAAAAVVVDEKEAGRRAVYWQYIRGMLTNASATMPLGQMAMMMKMLIADGFPWSNEELQEFLGEKVGDGELEIVGGKYRLVRK